MALKPYEVTILNKYKEELIEKNEIDGPDYFWPDQKITYEKDGRKINAQIDAVYRYKNKHYFVELYVTLAHDPIDISDYGDMKIKADACKLSALYMEREKFSDKWNFEKGKVLLLYSTYRSYLASKRNSVGYLNSLGIELDYTLEMTVPKKLIASNSLKSSGRQTHYKKYTEKEIFKILDEIEKKKFEADEESSRELDELIKGLNQ